MTSATGAGSLAKRALVTGAAAGIGKAIAEALASEGYRVTGADRSETVLRSVNVPGYSGVVCDVTLEDEVRAAVSAAASEGDRLDLLVCNAGIFTAGRNIADLDDATWERSLSVNLTGTMRVLRAAIPFLKRGAEPSVVIIGSRNVAAPGPGAAAYSVAKAGITQLARVAALELAGDGIRVNVVHPDAVFDTELWTPEALARSAERYGLTVEAYKRKNLMRAEIRSADVAAAVLALAGSGFGRTTGAQIPVDGGNDRVI